VLFLRFFGHECKRRSIKVVAATFVYCNMVTINNQQTLINLPCGRDLKDCNILDRGPSSGAYRLINSHSCSSMGSS